MTKTTKPRREPSELDGKIAAIRKAARVLARAQIRALEASQASLDAQQAYDDACRAVLSKPGAGGES